MSDNKKALHFFCGGVCYVVCVYVIYKILHISFLYYAGFLLFVAIPTVSPFIGYFALKKYPKMKYFRNGFITLSILHLAFCMVGFFLAWFIGFGKGSFPG
ncbi:MAG: hypothetical protein FWH04_00115 [Oscillospiraceae bacterium]|nr:hypothetical protein [Oscillospiraceae bacterium]